MKKKTKNIIGFLVGLLGCILFFVMGSISTLTVSFIFQLLVVLLVALLVIDIALIHYRKELAFLGGLFLLVFIVIFFPFAFHFMAGGIQPYFIVLVIALETAGASMMVFGFSVIEK